MPFENGANNFYYDGCHPHTPSTTFIHPLEIHLLKTRPLSQNRQTLSQTLSEPKGTAEPIGSGTRIRRLIEKPHRGQS